MIKGRLGLDQRAGLAASGDLGFPHILEHLQGVYVYKQIQPLLV